MFSGKELIDAIRSSLEVEGELCRLKAEVRAKVMKLLEGHKSARPKQPRSPHEVLILNELIRDYMEWMGYKYSSNVFVTESGLSKNPIDRTFITNDLGTVDTEKTLELPLLFCLIETLKDINNV